MTAIGTEQSAARLAGYAALIERYGVDVIPNRHTSRVAASGGRRVEVRDGIVEETFPSRYWPGGGLGAHLEFALKHDGTNLAILATLFGVVPEDDLLVYVRSRPTRQVRQTVVVSLRIPDRQEIQAATVSYGFDSSAW